MFMLLLFSVVFLY